MRQHDLTKGFAPYASRWYYNIKWIINFLFFSFIAYRYMFTRYKSHLHQTRGFSRVLCVKTRVKRRMPIPEGDLEWAFATLPGHNLVRL